MLMAGNTVLETRRDMPIISEATLDHATCTDWFVRMHKMCINPIADNFDSQPLMENS